MNSGSSGVCGAVSSTMLARGMEQSGFRPDQKQAFGGAHAGWKQFLEKLESVLYRAD